MTVTDLQSTTVDRKDSRVINTCPECHSIQLVEDISHGETYCSHCGLVLSSPDTYVGVEKVNLPEPFRFNLLYEDIHYTYLKTDGRKTTKYNHGKKDCEIIKTGHRYNKPKVFIFHRKVY